MDDEFDDDTEPAIHEQVVWLRARVGVLERNAKWWWLGWAFTLFLVTERLWQQFN